ncbi:hypothetical protein [Verrucosispora sp. WMMC514]|uniref:hypothetical protein n=1 Tax=Verrucosispora sp. WMMC514 TaxID=3015156 RepID=UPI00248B7343|nr:hypothetical protein [Verrucosispora sp. WMMC514]WBB94188.1 hypothetical protein O7597_15165 [Verrucosispora sp. WMMC514]
MADYSAELPVNAGTTLTQRTGTGGLDTVPAGSLVLARNTGAGAHTLTFTVGALYDGLPVQPRLVVIPGGGNAIIRVPAIYGNASGRVPLAIDGTAAEILYYVLAG